ncbi:hypothetical protein [Dialister invisus]|nr:hypothetical protein [Dialister invisus]
MGKTESRNMTRSEESMTLMTPYHPSSFRAGIRMPCEKDGKQ